MSAVVLREQPSLGGKRTASRAVGLGLSGPTVAFSAAGAAGKLPAPQVMIANTPPIGLPADPAMWRKGDVVARKSLTLARVTVTPWWCSLRNQAIGGAVT